ncbi:MAG: copper resistance protein CopC [Anaerolineae bacterium]
MCRKQRRTWWTLLGSILIGLLLGSLAAQPVVVSAHALMIRSVPEANAQLRQPPATIEMWFSEPLETGFSHARLLNSTGAEVASGPTTIDPADSTHMILSLGRLGPGIYTVAWQTLSQTDGHEFYGSFPLTILNPDGSRPAATTAINEELGRGELPTPGEVAGRWLALLGAMLFFGAPLFYSLLAKVTTEDGTTLVDHTRALVLKTLWVAVLALVVGSWLQIILLTFRLGDLSGLPNLLLGTRTGVLGLARQALTLTGLLLALWRFPPDRSPRDREPVFWLEVTVYLFVVLVLLIGAAFKGEWLVAVSTLILCGAGLAPLLWKRNETTTRGMSTSLILVALAALVLLSFSFGSHASAAPGQVWTVLGDYLHLLAAATWFGGLLLLTWLTWSLWPSESASLWPLLQVFSQLAGGSVFVLIVTGLFNSLVQLPSLFALFETAYGQVLLVKLALMGLVLAVAFLNNRLVRQHAGLLWSTPEIRLRFRGQMALEALIGLGLLISVAVLVQTPTPASSAAGKSETVVAGVADYITQADDLAVHVQILPNHVGQNLFLVHLYHEENSPIGEVQLVRLLFNYKEVQLGQAQVDLQPRGGNIFGLEGAFLNQAGRWDLSIYVRRRGLDDSLAQVNVEVPALTNQAVTSPWQNPLPGLPAATVVAGAVVALGLLAGFWYPLFRAMIKSKSSEIKPQA